MSEAADTTVDAVAEKRGGGDDERLNSTIALAVAVTATFTALCNVKDGNIVQAMAQDQASAVDAWSYYQAKGTKQNLAEAVLDQLTLERDMNPGLAAAARQKLDATIDDYGKRVKAYEAEKAEIKQKAEGYQADYDRLNVHDDQFDLAEALMSVSIALLGVTALIKRRRLLWLGIGMAAVGMFFGLAGFFRWGVHPDFVMRIFS